MLFSEPKIPQSNDVLPLLMRFTVSVLFSEPKIPQFLSLLHAQTVCVSFSALQRAENSSMIDLFCGAGGSSLFQCSSASRKFLNIIIDIHPARAIQFQCSSASRKFLNAFESVRRGHPPLGFSALQRAENSSMVLRSAYVQANRQVSVLFSEPKIPQLIG